MKVKQQFGPPGLPSNMLIYVSFYLLICTSSIILFVIFNESALSSTVNPLALYYSC